MAKFHKKQSKRMPARKRYKIEKKVRAHNRKMKKQAKEQSKKKKPKMIQVPNECPFKEDILNEIEAMRKHKEEEKRKQKEAARERKREELAKGGLEGLVNEATNKQSTYKPMEVDSAQTKNTATKEENSLKTYFKEFKKVLDAADVILEIVDARDPLGTRCKEVEEAVRSAKGDKRLVLVLNKADLVPRENLDQWLKYLRASLPAVAFKSSTQSQARRLGRRKLGKRTESMIQSNTCFGAELVLSLLGNYCRNSSKIKTSITVGVVGLPNVGKSSVINSLKRSKACNVGNVPGVTKTMQPVQLDSKIKLLDSPGIVFASSNESDETSVTLKNAVRIESLKDPFTPATTVLKRISRQQIMDLYDMQEFSTPDEFFAMKAARMGKFRKGGVPDTLAAARSILEDWNSGKIRYYTVPPEQPACHISSEIVNEMAKEFDLESFAAEERMMLDNFVTESASNPTVANPLLIDSTGPVTAMEIEMQKEAEYKVQKKLKKKLQETKKEVPAERKKKVDPLFEIEGNQNLGKLMKLQLKKEKKQRARREKAAIKLAGELENINFGTDDYDFKTDFTPA